MKARELAFQFLKDICIQKKYSNLLLRNELDKAQQKDKGLITQIVYGTLQNYRLCRYQWTSYVRNMPDIEVCILLDMSVYQLLYMDKVPAYAIINESVDIAKKRIHQDYGRLVNALLHKVNDHKEIAISGTKEEVLAIQTSHPLWLVNMWSAQYGYETSAKICLSNMETKPNAARVNTNKIDKARIMKEDALFIEGNISEDALIYQGSSLAQTSYYKDGFLSIQDEASQLVGRFVGPLQGESILDVCSAPGSKACHMAELMKNEGKVIAGDIYEHRVELIKEGAIRLGLDIVEAIVMDATQLNEIGDTCFDRVLCDVPCSGYGVLARKSDIKYHMQSGDMDTLIPLQQQILEKSSSHVKENGYLVYSTCTLNKKENEKQIEKFLKGHEDFELVQQETIFPYTYHSDGFFMAKMKKIKKNS
ncbi:MAG: 16S rRNA (cytosine(967)-C(5))-methyltransferase RsmB [Longicatena sp.]